MEAFTFLLFWQPGKGFGTPGTSSCKVYFKSRARGESAEQQIKDFGVKNVSGLQDLIQKRKRHGNGIRSNISQGNRPGQMEASRSLDSAVVDGLRK